MDDTDHSWGADFANDAPDFGPARERCRPQDRYCDFERDPAIGAFRDQHRLVRASGLDNPFFRVNQATVHGTALIDGREHVNFASYNYLGLCGQNGIGEAAKAAIDMYGTSVSASRIVSGERPIQQELEQELAQFLDAEDAVALVSGYLTNVTTIGHLFGPGDVIFYDRLAHNSAIQGAILSRARRIAFPHNDCEALELLLQKYRGQYRRALIFIEGVYSMDGDIADVPRFIALRDRYKTFLMVDEAHSLGVLGAQGGGVREHFGLSGNDIDIWMGTLSKTLASCGGYIAGRRTLVEYLRYTVPGFLYSVGISPCGAAAALAALRQMQAEPDRIKTLQARAALFLRLARESGLDTGNSGGTAVVPVIVGDSLLSIALSNALLARGINVQPILAPAVSEETARLRFFITSMHSEAQIRQCVSAVAEELQRLKRAA